MTLAAAHPSSAPEGPPRRLAHALRALRHRNYRLFFAGQGLSLVGTWMQRIALSWLVYRLTSSEFLLGVVGFASQIMTFLAAPFAGILADRMDRRSLVVATQVLAMIQAFVLAALTLTGHIGVPHILVLATVLGLINAFDIPIRQSFVVEMLESREDLPSAIALNSFMVNGARMVGPSVAGIVIAATGEGVCFLLNGLTFIAVIAALRAMTPRTTPRKPSADGALHRLRQGFAYALGHPPIRAILSLLAAISLLGMSYTTLMPVFAREAFGGGPGTLGLLMSAIGLGAMAGALFLAMRPSVRGLGRVMVGASILFGLAQTGFAWTTDLHLALPLLMLAGSGMMVQFASSNSLIQTLVEDDKRGRVMSLYVMAFMGMWPFGALLAGWSARHLGSSWTVTLGGVGCVVAALLFASRLPALGRYAHPIYVQLGIVPPPGEGQAVGVTSPLEMRL